MGSNIPGFQYDVFISYRQNDNRSGWVTEFVKHLQSELASIVKAPVSIYFDENSHDGIRETDLVFDSLADKLRCVIFIPILSQTYSDTKSFAWQHEFLAFKKMANEDAIGLKVKLSGGNTASRMLPIRIHELDADDRELLAIEMGDTLRSVDFVFKSLGVNRPLMPQEEHSSQTKISYRDQVNKVAHCIKEILSSLKAVKNTAASVDQHVPDIEIPRQNPVKKIMIFAGGVVLLLLLLFFFVNRSSNGSPDQLLEKSIAVLPFDDLSQAQDQTYFSEGVSEEIINALVKIEGLQVPGRTSSFQFRNQNKDLKEIGEKLHVSLILEGSVRKSGNKLRITAQLINAVNGYHLWSETYNHDLNDIFKAQDEVTRDIVEQLGKYLGVKTQLAARKQPTENLKAYDLYLKGHQQFLLKGIHVVEAQKLLKEAVELDPNFALGHAALAEAYAVTDMGFGNPPQALASAHQALAIDSTLSSPYAVIAFIMATGRNPSPFPSIEEANIIHTNFERALSLDPRNSTAHLWYGVAFLHSGLFQKTIDQLREAVQIDPLVPINYGILGYAEYINGDDSVGLIHLSEGVRLGWAPGNQRLAYYYLDHSDWEKAEYYFKEHAKLVSMSVHVDYHKLVMAVKNKDVATVREILDSITNSKGFFSGFNALVLGLVGDNDGVINSFDNWGFVEAMRPRSKEIRMMPAFKEYLEKHKVVAYWNKYGWPDVCQALGHNDFACDK